MFLGKKIEKSQLYANLCEKTDQSFDHSENKLLSLYTVGE